MNFRYFCSISLIIASNKKRKQTFNLFAISVVTLMVYFVFFKREPVSYYFEPTFCAYNETWTDGKTLKNVAENLILRSNNDQKRIFFHETSCRKNGVVNLTSRQSCAIESAG